MTTSLRLFTNNNKQFEPAFRKTTKIKKIFLHYKNTLITEKLPVTRGPRSFERFFVLEKLLSCLGNIHGQEETTADARDRYRLRKKRQTVSKRACGQPKNFASTGPGGDVVVSLSGLRGWRLRRKEFRRSSL